MIGGKILGSDKDCELLPGVLLGERRRGGLTDLSRRLTKAPQMR
jgi:hypothetical protein